MKGKHFKILLALATLILLMLSQGTWAQSTSDIGKVLAADGKMYKTVAAATNAGTTASGIIAYWGAAGSVESGNSSYRGMAIALEDAFLNWGTYPNHMEYCTSVSHQCSTATPYCSTVSEALNAKNGIAATQSAQANNGEYHWHNAVWNNSGVARPSGASDWAIPSIGQWNLMVQGLTGNSSNLSDTDNPDYHFNNLSTKINAAGGTYLGWLFYWSSTEKDAGNAWCFNVGGLSGGRNGSRVSSFAKNHNDEYMHVRMFFAFSSATAAVYTISYNANGGSGAPSSQAKDGGIDLSLSSTVPTRTGFAFAGWNTKADGSGTSYASGATFTGNANTTLYAQWTFQGSGTNENPYLIASTDHWNLLADKVNAGNTYSGMFFRLTNDISVTTMVGNSESNSFRGTFDGNGHTLTISYNTSSDYTAPFRYIQGATFKNLKVTGSIVTTMNLAAGIAGLNTSAAATFEQCVTDVSINSSSSTEVGWGSYDYHGGFLARTIGVNVNLTDCVCGGSVNGSSSDHSKGAGFVGLAENCTVTGTRCLSTTSYTNVSSWNSLCHSAGASRSVSVYYYVNANDTEANVGTQVTTSQLADGSYTTALQAGRPTTVWVQDPILNQPMLKLFANSINTNVTGYGNSDGKWMFIASPVAGSISPSAVDNLIGTQIQANPVLYDYDLFRFNQSVDLEWENYCQHQGDFVLENGKGYLYANKNTVTLKFYGPLYTGNTKDVTLAYSDSKGYNLVGNPFTVAATINKNYYKMNTEGTGIVAEEVNTAEPIPSFTGVIVQATSGGQSVTFTKASRQNAFTDKGHLNIVLTQANTHGQTMLDNAIVSFNEGSTLGKFYFGEQSANIYIPQNQEEYAIAYCDKQNEMPLNFVAHKNGEYTFTVIAKNVEMSYLHLIDHIAGQDIDLLNTPSYTFEAKGDDYESRFRLVFSANENEIENEDFAFISNGEIIINGEGTVQVIDMLGRQLFSKEKTSDFRLPISDFSSGVYVLRLIGNETKTQKIVIR